MSRQSASDSPGRAVDQVEADVARSPACARPVDRGRDPHRVVGAVEGRAARGRRPTACRRTIRVKPAVAQRREVPGVTLSGLASVVISTSGASPNSAARARHIAPRSAGWSRVGVPPPKKTVVDRHVAVAPARAGRSGSRAIAASAYDDRPAPTLAELVRGVGVEVAVAAAHAAERDVDVEPEGLVAELGPRLVGQQAVLGGDVAVGLRGGHFGIQPRAPRGARTRAEMAHGCQWSPTGTRATRVSAACGPLVRRTSRRSGPGGCPGRRCA